MKKMLLVLISLALVGAACKSETTIDTTAANDSGQAASDAASSGSDGGSSDSSTTSTTDSSGDDSSTTDSSSDSSSTTDSSSDDSSTTDSSSDSSSSDDSSSDSSSSDDANAFDLLGTDDWCSAAERVEDNFDSLDLLDFNDPDALREAYTEATALVNQAVAIAPPEIKDDVATSADGLQVLLSALEEADFNFLDIDLSVIEELDAGMQTATYNIELYNYQTCGIGSEPEPPADVSVPDSGAGSLGEGTVREQAVQGLVEAGFSESEAGCLLEQLDFTDPTSFTDTNRLFEVFADCDISLDRLAQLGN